MARVLTPMNQLSPAQIENIIDRLVPVIANPEDHEFFRGVLSIKAENSTASEFGRFVKEMFNVVVKVR